MSRLSVLYFGCACDPLLRDFSRIFRSSQIRYNPSARESIVTICTTIFVFLTRRSLRPDIGGSVGTQGRRYSNKATNIVSATSSLPRTKSTSSFPPTMASATPWLCDMRFYSHSPGSSSPLSDELELAEFRLTIYYERSERFG
ncbi:hypothetical protein HYPSUDRAFT_65140 [Hypholoma sublateritium FD-334 SS-4]|uniref:Uncharacterized protein n=1 Tax=Hypholoma sublateritium (strain FD-334 SS-4) TaxID=945553 RepID=A0A0D2P2T6_HYPSF|nr:hypothetical protein HYPSUDRAFT_65140 [Hypholoma sublateritium FD-334 SS-4]